MYIIQVYIDDGLLRFLGILRHVQKIGIDVGLLFYVVREKIVLGLKMVIKAPVRDAGFFADILDGELLVAFFLQDALGGAEDLPFCLLRF